MDLVVSTHSLSSISLFFVGDTIFWVLMASVAALVSVSVTLDACMTGEEALVLVGTISVLCPRNNSGFSTYDSLTNEPKMSVSYKIRVDLFVDGWAGSVCV